MNKTYWQSPSIYGDNPFEEMRTWLDSVVNFEDTAPLSSGRWQPSLTTLNCRARHCGQAAQRSSRPARVRSRAAFSEAEN